MGALGRFHLHKQDYAIYLISQVFLRLKTELALQIFLLVRLGDCSNPPMQERTLGIVRDISEEYIFFSSRSDVFSSDNAQRMEVRGCGGSCGDQ